MSSKVGFAAMNRVLAFFLATTMLSGVVSCAKSPDPMPVEAVSTLDLPRYMGRWFELAKYPNRFQTQCVGDTTATYRLQADGSVEVTNRCKTADGKVDQAVGRAETVGDRPEAKLRVRFAPAWVGWLPMVWGDYWVVDIDPDYSLVAVSEPRRDYLWILARTPAVDPARYQAVLERLRHKGFDTGHLVQTVQHADASAD
jgi:apolipoprotein D and lipocalin family protein